VWSLLREKLPWFVLSGLVCLVTYTAQDAGGAVQSVGEAPVEYRLANAAIAVFSYLRQAAWPADLSCFYPHFFTLPDAANRSTEFLLLGLAAAGGIALITVLVLIKRRNWPWVCTGWLWYLVTLLPVIGLVQVGRQAHADRYTYLPLTGIFVAVVWSGAQWIEFKESNGAWRSRLLRPTISVTAIIVIAVCVIATRWQVAVWRDSGTLFHHALAVGPESDVAHFNLGMFLATTGKSDEAADEYRRTLALNPRHAKAHNNLGALARQRGDHAAALAEFRQAVALQPHDSTLQTNLGEALLEQDKAAEAVEHLDAAVQLAPESAWAWYLRGRAHQALGQRTLAAEDFRQALTLRPGWPEAHNNLGSVYWQQRRTAEAEIEFTTALAGDPDLNEALANRGLLRCEMGRLDDGRADLRAALRRLPPDGPEATRVRAVLGP
jgi:Tfp pilus assembly protein PilF